MMKATRTILFAPAPRLELARRRQPQQRLSECLEVREVPLALLGHGVQVAEAPLERVLLEDRGRARRVIGIVHNLARRMDGVAGHATGGDALLLGQAFAARRMLVELVVAVE